MAIPPLVLRIYADSTGVKKGVAQANAQVSGLRASVVKNAGLIKTGLAAGFVAGAVIAVKAASDLGEAQNKANVIFGKSVGIVNELGDESASSFGIAKAAALDASGSFGAMFDSAKIAERASADMSVTMVKLAGDMASFNNQDPSEMLERLRSGLSGEAEPLRRFGVFISEARVQNEAYASGIAKTGQELTDAQKIQSRYNIILQDTKKQQGDFQRTLGTSFPNQLRVLKAELIDLAASIGKALLPAVLALVKAARSLLGVVKPLAPVLIAAAAGFAAWWTAGKIAALLSWATAFAPALTGIAVAALDVAGPLGLVAAGLGIVVLKLTDSHTRFTDFRDDLVALGATLPDAKKKADDLKAGVEGAGIGARFAGRRMEILKQETARNAEVAEGWAAKQKMAAGATDKSTEANKRETRSLRDLRNARLALAGGLLGVIAQLNTLRGAQKDVNDLEKAGKRGTQEYKDAKLTLLQEIVATKQGLADYGAELKKEGQTYPQVRAALVKLGREYGLTRADVLDVLSAVKDTNAAWARVPKNVRTHYDVTATVNGKPARDALINHIILEKRQSGGPVMPGKPYIVGEKGPELFVPHQSGTVVPTEKVAASSGVTVNVYGDVNDADRFAQKVEAAVNRAASRH